MFFVYLLFLYLFSFSNRYYIGISSRKEDTQQKQTVDFVPQ